MGEKLAKVNLRITIPKVLYDNMRRTADANYVDFVGLLPLLYKAFEREQARINPPPKPKKLTQAEIKRLEEERQYEEEMEMRKKEAARGAAILMDRAANPEKYLTQAEKDWRAAQKRNDQHVRGSLLDEMGDILGSPVEINLSPEDYFKIYGKHKPGHEPNPVRTKEEDDAIWEEAIAKVRGR
jgi:hypothetical protein